MDKDWFELCFFEVMECPSWPPSKIKHFIEFEKLDQVQRQVQEEGHEHPEEGDQGPVGLVEVPEVDNGERVGDHVGQVDQAVHQEEKRTFPPQLPQESAAHDVSDCCFL